MFFISLVCAGNQPAKEQDSKSESLDEFEQRMFGAGVNSQNDYILKKLNWWGKARDRSSSVDGGSSQEMPDLEQSFDTLSDGMDGKLKDVAQYFEIDEEECDKEDYAFRYDTTFHSGGTYDIKTRLDNPEVRSNNLERGFENLLEMVQNINQTLQQRGKSSGDSGIGAEGNLEGRNGSRSGAVEEQWRKLEIPLFSGDDAYGWVNRVERYFNLKGVLEQERLQAVMVAMEGKTLSWFRWWRFCRSNPSWEDFKAAVISKFQPEFDLDIWVQEDGSESWEQEYRGKNEALKFKNEIGREEAIRKEVEQVKETNTKIVVAEKEKETELELHVGTMVEVQEAVVANKIEGQECDADLGDIKTKKECFKEVSDKHPPPEPPDRVACVVFKTIPAEQVVILLQNWNVVLFQNKRKWDAVKENNFLGLMGQTQLIQVVYLSTKVYLEIHDELIHKFQTVTGSVLQAIRILCKTFKQKLEAGLGEAFKGNWLQEGLRGFSFDPGGAWLSAATSYSP
ncbi:hypothetical protein SESBI_05947 [Sesbania bispinosa]|nr:hypothetical protein SESBI_05947 [Sesbania bispinosa]